MKIVVDQEGMNALGTVCDEALKGAGMRAINAVNRVLQVTVMSPVVDVKDKKDKDSSIVEPETPKEDEKSPGV